MVTWTLEAGLHSSLSLLRLPSLDSFEELGHLKDLPLAMLATPRYMFAITQVVNWPIRGLSEENIGCCWVGFFFSYPTATIAEIVWLIIAMIAVFIQGLGSVLEITC